MAATSCLARTRIAERQCSQNLREGHWGQTTGTTTNSSTPLEQGPLAPAKSFRGQHVGAPGSPAPVISSGKRKRHHSSPPNTSSEPPTRPLIKRRKTGASLKAVSKPTKDRLSCPFAVTVMKGQGKCIEHDRFMSNGDVARHLQEQHGRPPYCPTCWIKFNSDIDRDDHIRLRQCEPGEPRQIEGLTSRQILDLSRFIDVKGGFQETWAQIYQVVIPRRMGQGN